MYWSTIRFLLHIKFLSQICHTQLIGLSLFVNSNQLIGLSSFVNSNLFGAQNSET